MESSAVTRPAKVAPAEISGRDANLAADADRSDGLLRNAEIDVDRVQRLERHDGIAARYVLSAVCLAQTQNACEGCTNGLAVDCGANLVHTRLGLLVLGGRAIELSPRR